MKVTAYFFKPRLSPVEAGLLSGTSIALIEGKWIQAVVLFVVLLVASIVGDRLAGSTEKEST